VGDRFDADLDGVADQVCTGCHDRWRCLYSADELRNLQRVASDGEHTA
jgi:hypothetical protein